MNPPEFSEFPLLDYDDRMVECLSPKQEVKISSAQFLLLRIPSLRIKSNLKKEVFEANLRSECDLWSLMIKEMWAGRKMADDHKVFSLSVDFTMADEGSSKQMYLEEDLTLTRLQPVHYLSCKRLVFLLYTSSGKHRPQVILCV